MPDAPPPATLPAPTFLALAGLARHGVLLVAADGSVGWASEAAERALGEEGRQALREAWPTLLARREADGAAACGTIGVGAGDAARQLRVEVHRAGDAALPYLVLVEALDGDAIAQLELANQALTNAYLASAMLHEVNAPLNNIRLTLALCEANLARSAPDALHADLRQRLERYFKVLGDETTRLGALLEELRRMSATAREARSAFDLRELASDIARLMRHEATIRQIRLQVQPSSEPLPVRADRRMLLLAMLGVVIHLVEQTGPEGVVSVAFERAADAEARIAIESTAASAVAATRLALGTVAGTLRPEDIPLVAARAQVEALHGAVHVLERDHRFGLEVRLPLST